MCGIAGIIDFKNQPKKKQVSNALSLIKYRGPDETGFFIAKNVALGINRLSIIDLKTGTQPIFNEDKTLVLVFNGEIYNYQDLRTLLVSKGHKLKTNSDTEVLVHLYEEYGPSFPKLLDGMFAFALYDVKKNQLMIGRDQSGIKPLYYSIENNKLIFGSEAKAVLKLKGPSTINDSSLQSYLSLGYIMGSSSIYQGISKLDPGTVLTFSKKGSALTRFWQPKINNGRSSDLDSLLDKAIVGQTVSDVPWGVFLSGGIDSSLIVHYLVKNHKKVKTFSISFTNSEFDESHYAKKVSDIYHTDHHVTTFTPKDMVTLFPRLTKLLDEPFSDPSLFPTYKLSQFTQKKVKVALSGDGGDELFGGYPTYKGHLYGQFFEQLPNFLNSKAARLSSLMPNLFGKYDKNEVYKRFFLGLQSKKFSRHLLWNFQTLEKFPVPNLTKIENMIPRTSDKILQYQIFDYLTYLRDDLLFKTDRASMYNSLEVRVPFLSESLINYAWSNPRHVTLWETKIKLRNLAKKFLPEEITNRPKKGFGIPLASWSREDLKDLLYSHLFDETLSNIVSKKALTVLWESHIAKKEDNSRILWSLAVLSSWAKNWHQNL